MMHSFKNQLLEDKICWAKNFIKIILADYKAIDLSKQAKLQFSI